MSGPLAGVRIVELAGLGALPFASLKLADLGADIVRVDRASSVPDDPQPGRYSPWDRGRRSIAIDLKQPGGVDLVLRLVDGADGFMESFRPGVAERLGLGPEPVMERNPAIVYGRLTGWGQDGPLSHAAGHSLNYEALTGVVRAIGPAGGPPVPLLQMLGDFAGGGLHLAFGMVCAILEARSSGHGQVIDVSMSESVISLMAPYYGMAASGFHSDEIGENLFDGGSPYYNVYETADGGYVSVAPIEPHFYAELLARLGLDAAELPDQDDRARWPELKEAFARAFAGKSRAEWERLLDGTDACFAPVVTFAEAAEHPHHRARRAFRSPTEPEAFPRMSRTPGGPGPSPAWPGADTDAVLDELGVDAATRAELRAAGAIR